MQASRYQALADNTFFILLTSQGPRLTSAAVIRHGHLGSENSLRNETKSELKGAGRRVMQSLRVLKESGLRFSRDLLVKGAC